MSDEETFENEVNEEENEEMEDNEFIGDDDEIPSSDFAAEFQPTMAVNNQQQTTISSTNANNNSTPNSNSSTTLDNSNENQRKRSLADQDGFKSPPKRKKPNDEQQSTQIVPSSPKPNSTPKPKTNTTTNASSNSNPTATTTATTTTTTTTLGTTAPKDKADDIADPNKPELVFPLARIKKILKTDKEITKISQDATWMIGKATELFLVDFAAASFKNTKRAQRKTLQVKDMQAVANQIEPFEFLTDLLVIPTSEDKKKLGLKKDQKKKIIANKPDSNEAQDT